jgi:ubiquinone/menaquinone biosynthesis C-methylase UbiE
LKTWKDKRKVMQCYDLTAEMYEERYAEEQRAKYETALKTTNVLGTMVLDAGCATGLFFDYIASKASSVVGIDISHRLLLKASKRARFFENAFVLQADVDYLPFKEELFQAIFAFTVLQNMPNPSETLIELKRVAKHDGRMVVTGLKKAFSETKFMSLLEEAASNIVSFVDSESSKCYIAVLTT